MLQSRRRENRVEPLVFLQRQLGHASIQSTLIYLHLIHELVDDAVIAYDAELDAFTGAAGG
jgi:integrase/recombinase XerD